MRKHIVISVIGSIAMGLLAAGCGGGDDNAEAEQIDKATFVKKANKICESVSGKLTADITSINRREVSKPDYDIKKMQVALVKEGLVPRLEEEIREIRGLGIPADAQKEAKAFLAAMEESIDRAEAKPRAVALGIFLPYASAEVAGTRIGISQCPVAPAASESS